MSRLVFLGLVPALLAAQTYDWPIPGDVPRWINGTFCECRASGAVDRHHFHDGVDIHLPAGRPVYSVISGTVISIGTAAAYGINAWIRVGRYAYVHVNANPNLEAGDYITAYSDTIGVTNSWNHIHFKDGYPGSERNPIRIDGGLTPIEDVYPPEVRSIQFYPANAGQPFLKQKVFGRIDIVARAMDTTDDGPLGSNNGVYSIGYRIIDSSGAVIAGQTPFKFDFIPSSDSYTPIVYAPGSNTSTYYYEVTNTISQDRSLDVSDWPRGDYTAEVFALDPYGLGDTARVSFAVTDQDTTPPDPPTFLSALATEEGFRLTWTHSQDSTLRGYRLYFSYDGVTWNSNHREDILTAEVTTLSIPIFSEGVDIYFHLTAVDDAAITNESGPSDFYGLRRVSAGPRVLIVDSFDRTGGGWTRESHDFMTGIGQRLGMGFEIIADEFFRSDSLDFAQYDAVIIHDGDDLTPLDSAFSSHYLISNPASRVRWYMGTRLLEVWPRGDPAWQTELQSYPDSILALPGHLEMHWDGTVELSPGLGQWQPDSALTILSGQVLDSASMAMSIVDEAGHYFGVSIIEGPIITMLPLETMGPDAIQDAVMAKFKAAFGIVNIKPNGTMPEKFTMQSYPNPFNNRMTLDLNLPATGSVELVMFTLLGQEIWSRSESMEQGQTRYYLPAEVFDQLASGVYIFQARYRNGNQRPIFMTKKSTLIK